MLKHILPLLAAASIMDAPHYEPEKRGEPKTPHDKKTKKRRAKNKQAAQSRKRNR